MSQESNELDLYEQQAVELIDQLDTETLADLLRSRAAAIEQGSTPEAVGSCSTYIAGPGGTEVLVTSRGASLEYAWDQMSDFLKRRIAQGFKPVIKGNTRWPESTPVVNNTVQQPTAQAQQPVQQTYTPQAGAKEFACGTLEVSMTGGKTYYRIKSDGGPFTQFGVVVWPEVFKQIGLDVDANPLPHGYNMQGYVATYVEGPSKKDPSRIVPQKVISLRKM